MHVEQYHFNCHMMTSFVLPHNDIIFIVTQ